MAEIHKPDFDPRHPGGSGDIRFLLSSLLLVFMLFFGYQYISQLKPSAPISGSQMQSQMVHAEIAKGSSPVAGGQSVASPGNFGWLTFIAKPVYLALRFLHDHGIGNWGWSIIVLTVIFNLMIIWPRMMSMESSLKMMRVQPKVDALKKRYAHLKLNDPKRAEMNAEMMALYQAEGANAFGGCLPLLLQTPLLFAYVSVLRNASELHQANWLWLTDLSLPDPLHILPLLITGSMILTQCITPTPGMSSSQRWMFAILMPVVMGFSLWHNASGLSLYWVTGNIINLLIQFAINRSKLGKEMHALAAARTKIIPGTNEN
ncbi:MAG: membrane protein insertase YidC [Candidatus Sulfotelmatobacter sp.]